LTIDQDDSYQSSFGDVSQSSGGGASRDSFQSSPRKVFRASKPSTRERVMTKPSIEELLTLNKDDARRTMRAFQIVNGEHGEGSILSDLYSLVGLKNS
jgi:hypothetical protein